MQFKIGNNSNRTLHLGGRDLELKTTDEWIFFNNDQPVFQFYLLGSDLIIIQSQGKVPRKFHDEIIQTLDDILNKCESKVSIIAYLSIPFIDRNVRSKIIREELRLLAQMVGRIRLH